MLWGPRFKWESLSWCKEKAKQIFQKWERDEITTGDIKTEIEHAKVESLKKKRDYIVKREALIKQQLREAKTGNICVYIYGSSQCSNVGAHVDLVMKKERP